MRNKILSTLNIGNNSYEIDDTFARQKVEEVNNNLLKINPVYSASGSVVSFDDGADNLPLEELIVDINPIQDLHGYDHPWIGGSGKNLFENKFVTSTINGVTATIDEEGIVILNGTATGNVVFDIMPDTITLPSKDSYIVSGGADGGGTNTYRLYFEYYNYTNEAWNGLTCTSADSERPVTTDQIRNVKIQVFNGATCDNAIFKPMLRKATETDATFEPYENICPITGWAGMNVQRCGKNLFDKSAYVSSDITYHSESGIYTRKGIRVDLPSGTYTINCNSDTVYAYIYMFKQSVDGNYVDKYYLSTTTTNGWKAATVTIANGEYLVIVAASSGDLQINDIDLQIEIGSVATKYEPYNGTEIPISWESEAGTVYSGNLNVLTGVLTVNSVATSFEFATPTTKDTKNRWVHGKSLPVGYLQEMLGKMWAINDLYSFYVSNLPIIKEGDAEEGQSTCAFYGHNNSVEFRVRVDAGKYTAEEAVQIANAATIVYPIEPVTYQLTPHEVKTLLGQNNIFTNINSNNILVSYKADMQKCIDNKLNIDETAHRTTSILYGQVDATSTSTKFTATIDGITEYFDGLTILLKNEVVASASGFTIDINGLGGKSVFSSLNITSKETTAFTTTSVLTLIYDSTLDNGNGGWIWYKGQDKDTNTIGYAIRTNSKSLPLSSILYRYKLLFTSADRTHYIPANNSNSTNTTSIRDVCQEKIDPFGDIVYYGTTATIQPENRPSPSTLWLQNALSLGYSFNRTGQALTLELWKPVYVKATPYVDGSAIIDADEPYVQDLPITDDGKIYIYLGVAYNTASVELSLHHPIYYCYNGAIRPWLGFTDSEHVQDIVSSVNSKTGTVTLTAEDVGAMEGMTILSYGHSTWAEFLEAYKANRIVYCKASISSNPSTGQQGRMAFLAYVQYQKQGYSDKAEFQYYRSVSTHTDAQQGDQVFCYYLTPINGGTWSVEVREASSRVIAGTGLAGTYTQDNLTLSLDTDYKNKIDTLWADYQSRIGQ